MENNNSKEEINTNNKKNNNTEEKIRFFLEKWTKLVDPKIKEILSLSVSKRMQKLINYQVAMGGKRFRPALTIASCLVCNGKIEDALYPAAGLEILHNYTLIYDDIIDNSELRRGKPTVWFNFGKSIAQCIGMDYGASIFQAANRSKNSFVISEIFSKTIKNVVEGEILDILFEQSKREDEKYIMKNRYKNITEDDYLKMVSKKTSSLICACCEVGALVAEARESEIKALKNYGFNLGAAFQIKDDILDIFGEEKDFGKKIGKDIEERKLGNVVIFHALKEFSSKEKEEFLKILRKDKIESQDIKKAVNLIKKTKAQERSFSFGEKYIERAKESLKKLPKNKWNEFLSEIADFVIKRKK